MMIIFRWWRCCDGDNDGDDDDDDDGDDDGDDNDDTGDDGDDDAVGDHEWQAKRFHIEGSADIELLSETQRGLQMEVSQVWWWW